jgi:AcrR family transcriptional regulator
MEKRRARSAEAKAERRDAILTTARAMFERDPRFASFTMQALAGETGLAKGTAYLYFRTKEELFLALLQREFDAWFEEVDGRLERGRAPWTAETVAALLADSAEGRETLVRLLAIQGTILEQNVEREPALAYKTHVLARTADTGRRLEARLPYLGEGGGARLLLRLHALVVGLWQLAEPAPVVRAVMEAPEMAAWRIDFIPELRESIRLLLRGMEADGR